MHKNRSTLEVGFIHLISFKMFLKILKPPAKHVHNVFHHSQEIVGKASSDSFC